MRFPECEYIPDAAHECLVLTVVYWPPERICAIDLAMDGFSATHNTRMYYARITVVVSRGVRQKGGVNELMSIEGERGRDWNSGSHNEHLRQPRRSRG